MIIIAGTLDFDDAKGRDACVAASAPFQQATRGGEAGCQAYVFAADPVDPKRMNIHEIWDDAETLAAHLVHENYWNMRAKLGEFGPRKSDVWKWRTDAQDRVYGEDGIASATFWSVEQR